MSELSHDTADDGFHEIQLSGKQLVFLFIVTTTVVVVVFLCGVLVGRGAREPKVEEPTPVGATETTPAAPVAQAGPPAIEPPAPAADAPDKVDYNAPKGETATPDASRHPVEESKPAAPLQRLRKSRLRSRRRPPPRLRSRQPRRQPSLLKQLRRQCRRHPQRGCLPLRNQAPGLVQVMATREQGIADCAREEARRQGISGVPRQPGRRRRAGVLQGAVGRYSDRAEAEQSLGSHQEGRKVPVLDFALALLSGALLALSFPKFGHPAFAWIALTPLVVAVRARASGRARVRSSGSSPVRCTSPARSTGSSRR